MNRKQRRAKAKAARPTKVPNRSVHTSGQKLFAEAMGHHTAGRLAEAEHRYKEILNSKPENHDALHYLGVVYYQRGDCETAADLIGRSIDLCPENAEPHNNLGNVLQRQGKRQDAAEAFLRAIAIKPDYPDAHHNLATIFKGFGKLEEAADHYRRAASLQPEKANVHYDLGSVLMLLGKPNEAADCYCNAIEIKPDFAAAHGGLGAILRSQGKLDDAVASHRRAITHDPDSPIMHANLGNAYLDQNKNDEAERAYRNAIDLKPDYAEAHNNLGIVLKRVGKLDEAIAFFKRAAALAPNDATIHDHLGNAFMDKHNFKSAAQCFRKAVACNPDNVEAHNNLGNALRNLNQIGAAIAAIEKTIELKPDYVSAQNNLGNLMIDQGRIKDAVSQYRHCLILDPKLSQVHSSMIFHMNCDPAFSESDIWAESRRWDMQFGHPSETYGSFFSNDRLPDRRLKIGYVSPDFWNHSVSVFFEPVLAAHDRDAYEVFCYSDVSRPDEITKRLVTLSDNWLSILRMEDDDVAEQIRRDGIDILVDLTGHSTSNRLKVFALKPAPIQVTWLGYPNSTGLAAMDYRLTDDVVDPKVKGDKFSYEELFRLPRGYHCYGPPKVSPEVVPPPFQKNGFVTFGSFNNLTKVTPQVVDTWSRLLANVPGSRLLIKSRRLADPLVRSRYIDLFKCQHLSPERIELVPWVPSQHGNLAAYGRVDVALDTFPYNGTTTTCEALWMGVPVVTLFSDRPASRVGASLMSVLSLDEFVVKTPEDYVAKAATLASEPQRLNHMRSNLRQRLLDSPLCDQDGFARDIEMAFRTMWHRWCADG